MKDNIFYHLFSSLGSIALGIVISLLLKRHFSVDDTLSNIVGLVTFFFSQVVAIFKGIELKIAADFKQLRQEISGLADMNAFPENADLVSTLASAHKKLTKDSDTAFIAELERQVSQLKEATWLLASGHVANLPIKEHHPLLAKLLFDMANAKIYAITWRTQSDWWETDQGQLYYEFNRLAAKRRGVEVHRVFLLDTPQEFATVKGLASKMSADKMYVYFALMSDIKDEMLSNNFILYLNRNPPRYVTWFSPSNNGSAVGKWNWSKLAKHVDQAAADFEKVKHLAKPFGHADYPK